jgi:uncharacterized membrane protein
MDISRIIKHVFFPDCQVRRTFPKASLDSVEAAIRSSEQDHVGEVRFVVEANLEGVALWQGQTARERAIDVFSQLRIWDTEGNNGVLIYVLLADRSVEIVADRGIHARTGDEPWATICRDMEFAFSKSEFLLGTLTGIAAIANVIGQHFPAQEKHKNELPDSPVVLT